MSLDAERLREDFPILRRTFHGKRFVYLDNAATTQKPSCVIDRLSEFYRLYNSNVHRGAYTLAEEATDLYEKSRANISAFIGGKPEELVFVRGATEAINMVAYSYALAKLEKGDTILSTEMEHHSNIVPWQLLQPHGLRLDFVKLSGKGELSLEDFKEKITRRTKLVTFTHASNVLGTINPASEFAKIAHDNGSKVLVDGAQSVPHMPVDVRELGADFYAFSGHKMLGPMGIGGLYAKSDLLEEMAPFQGGGEMIKEVGLDASTWAEPPQKFEAGTPNVAGSVGLSEAVDYLRRLDMSRVREHEKRLSAYALQELESQEGVRVFGPGDPERRGGVISFEVKGVHPHDLATILDREGVAIRSGHHCAQPVADWLGVSATARASFYIYNDHTDIDSLISALGMVRKIFGRRA